MMHKDVLILNDLPNLIFEYHYFNGEMVGRFIYDKNTFKRVSIQSLKEEEQLNIFKIEMDRTNMRNNSVDASVLLNTFIEDKKSIVSEPFTNPKKLGTKFTLLNIEHLFGEWQLALQDNNKEVEGIQQIYIVRIDAFEGRIIKPDWNEEQFKYQVEFIDKAVKEKNQLYFISVNADMYFHAYRPDERIFFYHAKTDNSLDCLILDNGKIINIQELPMMKAKAVQKDVVKYAKLIDKNFLIEEPTE